MKIKKINPEKLNYKIIDSKKNNTDEHTPIVYLNNYNEDFSSFNLAADHLSKEFQVILYNPFITNTSAQELIDIDFLSDSLYQFIEKNNLNNIHLISNGFSSIIAKNLLNKYPGYVKSMILEDFSLNFAINDHEYDLDYSTINIPTLLLRGSKSKNILPQQNQDIVMSNDLLRSTSVENVENNSHFNNVEGFVSQVSKFISIFS